MRVEGNGTPLQYSCLENPMDGGAWKAAVQGVAEGRTRLSDLTFTFSLRCLQGQTHCSESEQKLILRSVRLSGPQRVCEACKTTAPRQ